MRGDSSCLLVRSGELIYVSKDMCRIVVLVLVLKSNSFTPSLAAASCPPLRVTMYLGGL